MRQFEIRALTVGLHDYDFMEHRGMGVRRKVIP